jgi:D-tyrosyl-tRNA(Tyr) deacylase
MRAVIQRVKQSSVSINNSIVSEIQKGLLVLLGIAKDDEIGDANYLAEKIIHLRIFEDENGKMNRSLLDTGGEMLVVSQFTLLGNCSKGRRPSFIDAAGPEKANELYEMFSDIVRQKGIRVKTGKFQEMMDVSLTNDGPVTLVVESK